MRPIVKITPLATVLLLGGALSSGQFGTAGAQDETKLAKSARGGTLAKTTRHQFEVFSYATGLRVYPLDSAGSPIDAAKLTGTATFYHPNSPKPWFSRPLHSASTAPGQAPASLDLVMGLSAVPPTGAKVAFEIAGLPDAAEPTATFTVPFELVTTPTDSVGTHPSPPSGAVTPNPRYVYGPGYYGYGYYQYPGPETAPAARTSPTVYGYRSSGSSATHDWSTGRDNPSGGLIGKPWLRPMD